MHHVLELRAAVGQYTSRISCGAAGMQQRLGLQGAQVIAFLLLSHLPEKRLIHRLGTIGQEHIHITQRTLAHLAAGNIHLQKKIGG